MEAHPACPSDNGTEYSTAGKNFLIACGIDYSGDGGAVDLGNLEVASTAACITACADNAACTGCGWGDLAGDTGPSHRCWLKQDLQNSRNATASWTFAILRDA